MNSIPDDSLRFLRAQNRIFKKKKGLLSLLAQGGTVLFSRINSWLWRNGHSQIARNENVAIASDSG